MSGHNHISGIIEKVKRYHSEKWTYEQDPNAKVCVFHGRPNPAESNQKWVKRFVEIDINVSKMRTK